MEYTWLYAPKKRASSRVFSFFLYSGPCATPGGYDLWRVRLITMRPARIHKEISQILIQLSRLMTAGLWRRWRLNDLSRRQMRGTTTAVSVVVESKKYPGTSWNRGILDPAKRVNGRGSDLLSFRPRIVTNLRDRVTVRLTTTRRRNAAS